MLGNKKNLLELYKIHSSYASALTQTREIVNSVMISSNFVILSVFAANLSRNFLLLSLLLPVLGVILNIYWNNKLKYFKKLSEIKFSILIEIEQNLCFKFYEKEYDMILKSKQTIFTDLDRAYAKIFFSICIIAELYILISNICPILSK